MQARAAGPSDRGRKVSTITATSSVRSWSAERSMLPGLGAVDEAGRVHRDRPHADARPGPAHEVARRVEDHLVAVDVGVVVGHLDRPGVEVVGAGDEGADHEPRALERLVDVGRLVDAAHDGLEVVDR